jgi:phage terminase small subunit
MPRFREVLSSQQRRFVEEYMIDYNATAAYQRAGCVGTRATARRHASRLLTHADLSALLPLLASPAERKAA